MRWFYSVEYMPIALKMLCQQNAIVSVYVWCRSHVFAWSINVFRVFCFSFHLRWAISFKRRDASNGPINHARIIFHRTLIQLYKRGESPSMQNNRVEISIFLLVYAMSNSCALRVSYLIDKKEKLYLKNVEDACVLVAHKKRENIHKFFSIWK